MTNLTITLPAELVELIAQRVAEILRAESPRPASSTPHWITLEEAADRLEHAIAEVIRKGEKVTYDLKATRDDPTAVGTSQFADAVIEEMNRN